MVMAHFYANLTVTNHVHIYVIKPQLAIARLLLHALMMSICLSVAKMPKKRDFLKN